MSAAPASFKSPWLTPSTCLLVIIGLLLPFCNFKCGGIKLATVQGIDMIIGGKPEIAKDLGTMGDMADKNDKMVDKDSKMKTNIWVVLVLVAAVAGLGLHFVQMKDKHKVLLGVAAVGILSLLIFAFTKHTFFNLDKIPKGDEDGLDAAGSIIKIGLDMGWWLCLVGFAGLGYLSWMGLQNKPPQHPETITNVPGSTMG